MSEILKACAVACLVFVASVTDGDSLEGRFPPDGEVREARLAQINAPELYGAEHAAGKRAATHLRALLENRAVELHATGVDAYGRVLVWVHADGPFSLNTRLVADGYAAPEPGYTTNPWIWLAHDWRYLLGILVVVAIVAALLASERREQALDAWRR